MKQIPVEAAEGMVLAHDMTRIIPGSIKEVAFKKGHQIRKEDIPRLQDMGKNHIYVLEMKENVVHEDEAAIRLASAAAGQGIQLSEPKEGKVTLRAAHRGLVKINLEALEAINDQEGIVFATIHTNQTVEAGNELAGTKIIPLLIEACKIQRIEEICEKYEPVIQVKPFRFMQAGILVTGTEVYEGRIQDGFGPVLKRKFQEQGCPCLDPVFAPDDAGMIGEKILSLIQQGADIILVSGGMSVDPDDVTPTGIKQAGAQLVSYGAPMLPGSMFLLSYLDEIPVLGLPGCVMFNTITIFDLVLQRILAGERLERRDITRLGHGGICMRCTPCTFPHCGFGKGGTG